MIYNWDLSLGVICLLVLVPQDVEPGPNQKECCSKRMDNLIELKTLTDIMLELIIKCQPSVSNSSKTTEPDKVTINRAPTGVTQCDKLHDFPYDCVYNFCDYDYKQNKCLNGDSMPFVKGDKATYIWNPCHCNKAGFAYEVNTGGCRDRKPICENVKFFPGSCQRKSKGKVNGDTCPDIYYAYNGVLCKNEVQKGNCEIEKTVVAVNLATYNWHNYTFIYFRGGQIKQQTDQDNVLHKFDHEIKYSDPHGLVKGDRSDNEKVNGRNRGLSGVCSKPLIYGSQIWGDHNKKGGKGKAKKQWKGVLYDIPLTTDGIYELVLKNVENQPQYVVGTRAFNIFFNGVWILPEVDILHTSKILFGIDWIVNFKVVEGGKKLKMMGYEDSAIEGGVVKLGFYFGLCGTYDENFHVAAFSVNKLKV